MKTAMEKALAIRAFSEGFANGADPLRSRKRHAVDPSTHESWRRGFAVGREAVELASKAFREQLDKEGGEGCTCASKK